jgi:nucleotide-binding universal stress UspA family protein
MAIRQRSVRKSRKHPKMAARRTASASIEPMTARPVLVATDGSRAAAAAIKFASAMAGAGRWRPEAVTVLEHYPLAVADFVLPVPTIVAEPEISQGVIGMIRRQLRRFGAASWKLRVQFGRVASTIVELAHQQKAELIVVGLGKHGKLGRLFGAETASRICRLTDTPILAVDANARELPHTAIVAMDFGDSSVRAAREILDLLQSPGRLHLLHVLWGLGGGTLHDPAWERTYAAGVEHGFQRLRQELKPQDEIEITSELRSGGVVETILKVANEIDADVLVVGSHSQNVIDRLVIGSTPAQLLRAAKCSVLIAPPTAGVADAA